MKKKKREKCHVNMSLIYQSWVLMPFSLTMEMLHGLT